MKRVLERLCREPMTRIVAFGSSNTDRGSHSQGRHNWVDWLDVGLREHCGRVHHTINAGVSGDHTRGLLARFDRDVRLYQPHLVIVTIGGNDCNPPNGISLDEYAANLRQIVALCRGLGDCLPILQTYYSIDAEEAAKVDPERTRQFPIYMKKAREVARETDVPLADHLARWERLRLSDVAAYRGLMLDAWHVNWIGNMVLGLDLLRQIGVTLAPAVCQLCQEGLAVQERLDRLGNPGKGS